MEILYLLIPLSALLVLLMLGVFGWALNRGQFDDVDREGERILQGDPPPFDQGQPTTADRPEQSLQTKQARF